MHCEDQLRRAIEGQLDCWVEVVIAIMAWPEELESPVVNTAAGRRFMRGPSVMGNGTTATSQASQITEGLVIFWPIPFFERSTHSVMPRGIEALDLTNPHLIALPS